MSDQRERFEAAMGAKLDLEPIEYADGSFHYYADRVAQVAWEAWQKACPEGWQAVPVNPTGGMLAAIWENDPFVQYPAMLDSAPKPEDV